MSEADLEVVELRTDAIIEYAFNNRIHRETQVDRIANSISEFGWTQPLVVDEDNVLLVGHGRLAAAKKLGLEVVPVVKREGLTEAQKKAYRILDNKLQNDSEWDVKNLKLEIQALKEQDYPTERWGLDALLFSFTNEGEEVTGEDGEKYTRKIEAPIYKPTGECPSIGELFDTLKCDELLREIDKAEGVSEDVKEFLSYAAQRHIVFNYQNIAEFYAHASPEVQRLMENSALVIIDFNQAIEKGFVKLTQDLAEVYKDDAC